MTDWAELRPVANPTSYDPPGEIEKARIPHSTIHRFHVFRLDDSTSCKPCDNVAAIIGLFPWHQPSDLTCALEKRCRVPVMFSLRRNRAQLITLTGCRSLEIPQRQ
jgi:hypothetical protein